MVYEQIALDFFADSIIGHQESFKDCKVHYDGLVDSSITTIDFDLTLLYPDDKELKQHYEIRENADSKFWRDNKKKNFHLELKSPIKNKKGKKKYGRKSKVVRLMVFQNIQVGEKNFIAFRTFSGSGYQGYDLYFIIDNNGIVIDWTKTHFIF